MELTSEFLAQAARSEEPIRVDRGAYVIEVYVRKKEAWEMEPQEAPDPQDYTQHPLSLPSRQGRRLERLK